MMYASASRTCIPANGPVRSSKVPSGPTGLWIVRPFSVGEPEVVLAEGRARVHDAGAVLDRHEVARQHAVAALAVVREVREGRLVAQAEQGRAGHGLLDLGLLAENPLDERLGEDQPVVAEPRAGVGDVRVDGDRGVRHERPGHRRPGEQRDARVVPQRELHVHRGVERVAVALRHLVARQRGPAARAVGHDPVALGQEPLVEDLLQRPPDRLDVVVRERVVRVVGVDPEADPRGQLVPLVDVAQDRLAALRVELRDPVTLDVVLVGEAELLLDLELDGQAVAVPAALAGHEAPGARSTAMVSNLLGVVADWFGFQCHARSCFASSRDAVGCRGPRDQASGKPLHLGYCFQPWPPPRDTGRHRGRVALYISERAKSSRTLYGGHDAKVCGLGQLSLSLWLTGEWDRSDKALSEMIQFVDQISHVSSRAHSLDTEAVSAFYRDDYDRLADVSRRMSEFAATHNMQSLSGMSLLFGGWATAHQGNLAGGHETFQEGLVAAARFGHGN